jgi:hypothetical protein
MPQRWRSVTAVILLLVALAFVLRADTLRLTPTARAAAPHAFTIETWVVANLPPKALEWVRGLLPWRRPSMSEGLDSVTEYFALGDEVRRQRADLAREAALRVGAEDGDAARRLAALEGEIQGLVARRTALQGAVESALEGALSATLKDQSLQRGIGPVSALFPPPVFRLDRPPRLLVVSPRDRIVMAETRLLKPDLSLAAAEGLEAEVEAQENLSALVLTLGGLALYPSLVPDSQSLRTALQTIAHEWLHQYWFFTPLGQAYFSNPDMTTVNETAAEIAGRELGDIVYERLGFELPPPAPPPAAPSGAVGDSPPSGFDFAVEMRETRLEVDRLLERGLVAKAEVYMEKRRRRFVEHGHGIRKLNQAYFAFHGTYAVSPASSSPIAGHLSQVRDESADVGAFIRTVAGFGAYQELLDHVGASQGAP